nr:unnamed protein product [Callosobruchus chinensis]
MKNSTCSVKATIICAGIQTSFAEIIIVQLLQPKKANLAISCKLGSNEQPGSAKKSLIQAFRSQHYRKDGRWHEHVSSIATATAKRLGYLSRARKYFSPSNLLTLYKAQIRPSLEYFSHIWGAAALTALSILDAVQRRAIRLIGDPALTSHLQPLSHRRAVGDLSLFYRYSNKFCSSELTSIIPPLSKPARFTLGSRVGCLHQYLLSLRLLVFASPAQLTSLNLTLP